MSTVLITGAASGIGKECALFFAQQDYQVLINYNKNAEGAKNLMREINNLWPHRAHMFCADVSDSNQVRLMANFAKDNLGHIDVLINNAGISFTNLLTDTKEKDWDDVFAVNVKGAFNCTQAFLPDMISRRSGNIINISSIWGMVGASCEVCYSASKAALIGFTKALSKEVGPSGIRVNCIAPGVIKTNMTSTLDTQTLDELKEETPLQKIGSPKDIATTAFFLASENAGFITGQVISPNGGFIV